MYRRNIENQLLKAAKDTPIILINGARQVGKSTLAQNLFAQSHEYFTLDDPSTRASFIKDPLLFLEQRKKPVILDEIERAPEILLSLKKVVDQNRRSGFFILTGSAHILTLPKIAGSLAG